MSIGAKPMALKINIGRNANREEKKRVIYK
jgi:hypothetical protein